MGQRVRVIVFILVLSGVGILLGSSLSRRSRETSAVGPPSALPGGPDRVRVEVLNGAGVPGVAWEATGVLRDRGFDVVYYGNAGTYSNDPSVVMDRIGEYDTAELVAGALGIPLVQSEPDSTLLVDITVRLGPDWEAPRAAEESLEKHVPWWDLRRFFRRESPPESENHRP